MRRSTIFMLCALCLVVGGFAAWRILPPRHTHEVIRWPAFIGSDGRDLYDYQQQVKTTFAQVPESFNAVDLLKLEDRLKTIVPPNDMKPGHKVLTRAVLAAVSREAFGETMSIPRVSKDMTEKQIMRKVREDERVYQAQDRLATRRLVGWWLSLYDCARAHHSVPVLDYRTLSDEIDSGFWRYDEWPPLERQL